MGDDSACHPGSVWLHDSGADDVSNAAYSFVGYQPRVHRGKPSGWEMYPYPCGGVGLLSPILVSSIDADQAHSKNHHERKQRNSNIERS